MHFIIVHNFSKLNESSVNFHTVNWGGGKGQMHMIDFSNIFLCDTCIYSIHFNLEYLVLESLCANFDSVINKGEGVNIRILSKKL